MAIDDSAYLQELNYACTLIRNTISPLQAHFLERGFIDDQLFFEFDDPIQFSNYARGHVFFGRVLDEIVKAVSVVEELNEEILYGASVNAQRKFDEVALRQRKLFETFCLIVLLSHERIYQGSPNGANPARPGRYYLHFHLTQEQEHLRLRNTDLIRYFGGACADTAREIECHQSAIDDLVENHNLDRSLCRWNTNTRTMFETILGECSAIEKAAVGFGYQQIFGTSSSQIHLNMTGLYDPRVSPREFLNRADNLMLLLVSTTLRSIKIAEASGALQVPEYTALQNEFVGSFPNSYAGAAIGSANVGDIVSVFEPPYTFLGIVEEKRGGHGKVTSMSADASNSDAGNLAKAIKTDQTAPTAISAAAVVTATNRAAISASASAEYVSYLVQPIVRGIGRRGCFTDIETTVVIAASHLDDVLQDGINAHILTPEHVNAGRLYALSFLLRDNHIAIIQPYMNKANMPYLYFVERYLQRRRRHKEIQTRAYYLWIERGLTNGDDLRDWFVAESEL